ncbi:MAG: DUF4019 domain-containing protein [Rhodospirillaceae bacterium]|nr:MAG: DUF4019 domain-containing protein [Rhodospirillaceae bacterium]
MQKLMAMVDGKLNINLLLAFAFGTAFLFIMLGFAVWLPNPSEWQIFTFKLILSLAAGGVGAMLPGSIEAEVPHVVKAGGALALFVIVWFSSPAITKSIANLKTPSAPTKPVIEEFLTQLDSHDMQATFDLFDKELVKETGLTIDGWKEMYDAILGASGNLVSRKKIGVETVRNPPAVPVGLYNRTFFISKYAKDQKCRKEAVTLRATNDLQWTIAFYNVEPTQVDCI